MNINTPNPYSNISFKQNAKPPATKEPFLTTKDKLLMGSSFGVGSGVGLLAVRKNFLKERNALQKSGMLNNESLKKITQNNGKALAAVVLGSAALAVLTTLLQKTVKPQEPIAWPDFSKSNNNS